MNDAVVRGSAIIADGKGGFAVGTIEVDPPAAGEVRVAIAAAGVCHTDYASLHWPGSMVMGHEGAGHVEAIGAGVHGLEIGQPVLLNWAIPCGRCFQCERGAEALCNAPTSMTCPNLVAAAHMPARRAGVTSRSGAHSSWVPLRATPWLGPRR